MQRSEARRIRVKVRTDARKESLVEKSGVFEISTKEPASNNRANVRIVEMLARHLRVSVKRLRIVAGYHSPRKTVIIT